MFIFSICLYSLTLFLFGYSLISASILSPDLQTPTDLSSSSYICVLTPPSKQCRIVSQIRPRYRRGNSPSLQTHKKRRLEKKQAARTRSKPLLHHSKLRWGRVSPNTNVNRQCIIFTRAEMLAGGCSNSFVYTLISCSLYVSLRNAWTRLCD